MLIIILIIYIFLNMRYKRLLLQRTLTIIFYQIVFLSIILISTILLILCLMYFIFQIFMQFLLDLANIYIEGEQVELSFQLINELFNFLYYLK